MRLALAQINPTVGDLDGNRALILDRLEQAREAGADLVVFPELAVTGYPPEDLLLRPGFVRAAERSLEQIARAARGIVAARRHAALRPRPLQRVRGLQRRRGEGAREEALPPELRRLRRVALLRARATTSILFEHGDALVGVDRLRGHVAAGPAGDRPRARRRAAARQHLGVAVPRRQGPRARGDVPHARARQLRVRRLLQHRRRTGRAHLRRALRRHRRRGRGDRPRARLRGGAARRRRRPVERRRAAADATRAGARSRTTAATSAR